MADTSPSAGYFQCGLPYNRLGHGPNPLVIFQGLTFEDKPLSGMMASLYNNDYRFLEEDYTIYVVLRRPGLPVGSSMKDMADDYAAMIRAEFNGCVDVIGVSTGGSIVQHFAADHPELVRKLIIHSSAHTLGPVGKAVQLQIGDLARQRRWAAAYAAVLRLMLPHDGILKTLMAPVVWSAAALMCAFGVPKDPSDLVVTVEAEDKHNFKDRLAEIKAPTLLVAGSEDPFYTPELFCETAAGIPNARLCLYEHMGHPASGKRFEQDVLAFLKE